MILYESEIEQVTLELLRDESGYNRHMDLTCSKGLPRNGFTTRLS